MYVKIIYKKYMKNEIERVLLVTSRHEMSLRRAEGKKAKDGKYASKEIARLEAESEESE